MPQPDPLAISRREVQRILEDLRREVETAGRPRLPDDPRRAAVVVAAAKARVLRHPRPWVQPSSLVPFWDRQDRLPTRSEMEGVARPARAWVPRLDGLDRDLQPWTGGFWSGLQMAGALAVHGGRPRLQAGRPWLEEDLERLLFPGRLSPPDRQGRRWLVGSDAWRVPAADNLGADVLAGLMSGARRVRRPDGVWLVVPRTESVLKLAGYWGLAHTAEGDRVVVSPFYGAILSMQMPAACWASFAVIRRAGGCPLLPLCYWAALWGTCGAAKGYIMPDRAGAIPFVCSHPTRIRRGWTLEVLHREAVRLGIVSVPRHLGQIIGERRARNGPVGPRNWVADSPHT